MIIPKMPVLVFRPYSNIQPFTVRDGATYLMQIEALISWLQNDVIPHIDKESSELAEKWEEQTTNLIENWETLSQMLVQHVDDAVVGVEEDKLAAEAAKLAAEAARDLAEQFASDAAEIQDPAVASLFNDAGSMVRAAADGIYAKVSDLAGLATTANVTAVDGRVTTVDQKIDGVSARATTLETLVNSGRLSDASLIAKHPVYRVYSGGAYPARIPNALNIFVGPHDPGLLMQGSDIWSPPSDVILASVATSAEDPSSDLYAAIQLAAVNSVPGDIRSPNPATFYGVTPNRVSCYPLPDNVSTNMYFVATVPPGWTKATLVVAWTHDIPGGVGNVRWTNTQTVIKPGDIARNGVEHVTSQPVGDVRVVKQTSIPDAVNVEAGALFSATIVRLGSSGADTFNEQVLVVGAWMQRIA